MKSILEKLIAEAVQELFGLSDIVFSVEHTELSHGDFASNVALVVGRRVGKNPKEVAQKIADFLFSAIAEKRKSGIDIKQIDVAGPGFINFSLTPKFFAGIVSEAANLETWGHNNLFSGRKILVEHSSPNLFKPFHIGHVMNNAVGESIARLAAYSGAQVTTISYPSDVSLGIGKAIWALMKAGGQDLSIAALGQYYVEGTKVFEESEEIQQEVRAITKKLYDKTPGPELELYERAKECNLEYFKQVVARLGSTFDSFIYESEAGETGAIIVRNNIPAVFEESEGAVVYKGEQDGLHTRVFINKEGYPTYEAKDIGLLSLKFDRFTPDLSLFVTDHQQAEYFKVVMAAAQKIEKNWSEHSIHRTHGRMSFKGQKMSSRLGGVPLAEDILSAITDEVKEKNADVDPLAAESIAIGALKFVILRSTAGKDINFDPETSLSFEGDSGPYLQYTAVRAGSILAKAKETGLQPSVQEGIEPTDVERLIARFPDVVLHATAEWVPHHIVGYLLELAQAFNSWYGNTKIIDESDSYTPHRLAITSALKQTITNGLWLLGISVPEKM